MIKYSRHARRRMRWRNISETDVEQALASPQKVEQTDFGRYNAYKQIVGRLLKVTYTHFDDSYYVATAVWKGE
jgi:hypothetical protein